jgi:hypothetical protein
MKEGQRRKTSRRKTQEKREKRCFGVSAVAHSAMARLVGCAARATGVIGLKDESS